VLTNHYWQKRLKKSRYFQFHRMRYFGTVLHKMLELIAKGIMKNEDDFNQEFDKQVKALEEDLQQNGYDFFVPFKRMLRILD
jgi:hypothetical protein